MKDTKARKANLQLKKAVWFPIGLTAMFLICTAFLPANAQTTKTDTTVKEEPVYYVVDDVPEFVGGEEARLKYLKDNVQYPSAAKEMGVQGQVLVGFAVEADGSISDVKILKSSGNPFLDEEAIRVTKLMPKWKPAKFRGKALRTSFSMPITFILEKDKPAKKK